MIDRFEVQEGNPTTIRYQVVKADETTLVTQADISAIKLYVYETETNTEMTTTGGVSLTVSNCVYNSAQPWKADNTGYNVAIEVGGSYLQDGGKTYRVEVKVTPTSGSAYYLRHVELETVETYSA